MNRNYRVLMFCTAPLLFLGCARFSEHYPPGPTALRAYLIAIVTYVSTYPEVGLPPDLKSLGGSGDTPTPDGALLIDNLLACPDPPCIKSGYKYTYTVLDRAKMRFQITAAPVEFGKTGKRSFFTDQSGVIRFTEENRPATADDPPLQ